MRIKMPLNWNGVSLNQLNQLTELKETDSPVSDFVDRIVILSGAEREKVESLSYEKAMSLTSGLGFLKTLPEAQIHKWIYFKNRFFKLKDLPELSNADFIDLNEIIESNIKEGDKVAKMMLILLDVKGRAKIKDWKFFLEMPVLKSYGMMLFFYNIVKKLLFETFGGLFGGDSTGEENTEGDDSGIKTIEDSKKESQAKLQSKWKWYSFVFGLTNDNPLKLDEAMKYTFYDSCVYYLYKKETKK